MVYVTVYNQDIPTGVQVPAYAYQRVTISDTFNVTLAEAASGVETPPPTSIPSSSGVTASKIPVIVGGVVGLALIGGLIAMTFLLLRLKQKLNTQNLDSSPQQSPNIAGAVTTAPISPSRVLSPPPGSYNSNPADSSSYSSNPYLQNSPPYNQRALSDTDNILQSSVSQRLTQNTGGFYYYGAPEF